MNANTKTAAGTRFMRRALALAKSVKGTTFPNPAVGAVVVDDADNIVGVGATDVCGGDHAEKIALAKAGEKARGATLYVTLEPCSHFGKTPPCTDAIIAAGIKKVVAATVDPNPLVCGKGFDMLRRHDINVVTGLLEKEAALINEDFFYSIQNKRPWVSLKLAMTLDGKIADHAGASKWITSEAARREVQNIRKIHGAIAVGKNTLINDDPKLTARCGRKIYYPARIVFCSCVDDIPKNLYFMTHTDETRSIVVVNNKNCGNSHDSNSDDNNRNDNRDNNHNINHNIDRTNNAGFEIWHVDSIDMFLDIAYREGVTSILIEGGQKLARSFIENGFVNKVYFFYANKIFGAGKEGIAFSQGLSINNCIHLRDTSLKMFGDDFLVTGYPA